MHRSSVSRVVVPAVAILMLSACQSTGGDAAGPRVVQPGAPGAPARPAPAPASAPAARAHAPFSPADVAFMQGMIHHHAQALDMTALLETRTERDEMRKLAQRISISQRDEIRTMRTWLADRGQPVPGEHAHHEPGAPLMPGMLTREEMAALEAARGTAFDRLFLQLMIKHHDGALVMVQELMASRGSAQDSDVFAFAADVEADQSMEINRMRAMLASIR